ncbi:MAG: flavodoxin family protein [Lachnospiraceae bacterium]
MKKKRKLWVKVLIALLIVIGIIAISVGGWLASVTGILSKECSPDEVVVGNGTKNALIIYQPSRNDTTSDVTLELAQQLANKDYTVTINYPSEALTYDIDMYDVIAFGTPVYMGKVSSVLESYVKSLSLSGKSILLYSTGMNLEDVTELSAMAEWVNGDNSINAIKLGKASPEITEWFLNQWEKEQTERRFTIHEPTQSGFDAITGATMK